MRKDNRGRELLLRAIDALVGAGVIGNIVFTDPGMALQANLGLAVLALVVLRPILGRVGQGGARFAHVPPDLVTVVLQLTDVAIGRRQAYAGPSPLGGLMICNLLAAIIGIGLTGCLLVTPAFALPGWLVEVHAALVAWAVISVAVYLVVVLVASRRLGVNRSLSMLTGYKSLTEDAPQD